MTTTIPPTLAAALAPLAADGVELDVETVRLLALAPGRRTRSSWVMLAMALRAVCAETTS